MSSVTTGVIRYRAAEGCRLGRVEVDECGEVYQRDRLVVNSGAKSRFGVVGLKGDMGLRPRFSPIISGLYVVND